ncbi:hypothetical protein ACO34A_03765 [Rhizobium sp. ACO-34A]|nr:hypothetical protein ACO34A_03765 [Rhizobium sp. ACO-34A]
MECGDEVSIGWTHGGGGFAAPVEAAGAIDLVALQASLKAGIDVAAEVERLKHITAGAGQAMTYQRKAEEAKACLSATDPVSADYPMLAAEIGITAETLAGVASIVSAAYEAWITIGSAIEAARLGAKLAVDSAETAEAAMAAAVIDWSSVTAFQ